MTTITVEQMAAYRATARLRTEQEQETRRARRDRAWVAARQAATMLRGRFGVARVVVFGSLAHDTWFSKTSDIDLAVWDIRLDDYFLAVAYCQDVSPEFSIDLVDMARCRPSLRRAVEVEGIDL